MRVARARLGRGAHTVDGIHFKNAEIQGKWFALPTHRELALTKRTPFR
jgi:hypothetical protein